MSDGVSLEPVAWRKDLNDRLVEVLEPHHRGRMMRSQKWLIAHGFSIDTSDAIQAAVAAERARTIEECAMLAECAFDDRGRGRAGHHSEMDWSDGYRDATRAAAQAIRARSEGTDLESPCDV